MRRHGSADRGAPGWFDVRSQRCASLASDSPCLPSPAACGVADAGSSRHRRPSVERRRRRRSSGAARRSGRRSGPHAHRQLGPALRGRASASSSRGTSRRRKQEFDRAVNVLLESPYGGRTEPRIREHFDRLVDRISAYEVQGARRGRRLHGEEVRAGVDRRAAGDVGDVRAAAGRRPELKEAVQTDLETVEHDIPIPLNQRVLAYIELFQGRLHDFIEEGMKRGSQYLPMIQERLPRRRAAARPGLRAARRERVQAERAVARQGQGRLAVHARHGARERPAPGLVHRRAVGSRKGDGRGGQVSDARWSKMFDGDWHLALASYNGGPGRVQRAMKRGGPTTSGSWPAKPQPAAARDARLRADDSRGDRHRPEPGAVRLRVRAEPPLDVRDGHAAAAGRPAARRRVDRHDHRRDPGAQPRAAPLDDAGPRRRRTS